MQENTFAGQVYSGPPISKESLAPGISYYQSTGLDTVSKQPQSVLQSTLNEQGEQLEKLSGLLGQLEDRLQSVLNTVPQEAGREVPSESRPPVSMVINQVQLQTDTVKMLQRRINSLLEELEV